MVRRRIVGSRCPKVAGSNLRESPPRGRARAGNIGTGHLIPPAAIPLGKRGARGEGVRRCPNIVRCQDDDLSERGIRTGSFHLRPRVSVPVERKVLGVVDVANDPNVIRAAPVYVEKKRDLLTVYRR